MVARHRWFEQVPVYLRLCLARAGPVQAYRPLVAGGSMAGGCRWGGLWGRGLQTNKTKTKIIQMLKFLEERGRVRRQELVDMEPSAISLDFGSPLAKRAYLNTVQRFGQTATLSMDAPIGRRITRLFFCRGDRPFARRFTLCREVAALGRHPYPPR